MAKVQSGLKNDLISKYFRSLAWSRFHEVGQTQHHWARRDDTRVSSWKLVAKHWPGTSPLTERMSKQRQAK